MICECGPVRNQAILATVVLTSVAVVRVPAAECNVGFVCPFDHYCYKSTGMCVKCHNCSSFNRVPSVALNCHQSSQDCGGCLPGFREEYFAQKVKREACVVSELTSTTTNTKPLATIETNTTSATRMRIISAAVFPKELVTATAAISVISVIIFTIIGVHILKRKSRNSTAGQAVSQDVEPPTSDMELSSSSLMPIRVGNLSDSSSIRNEQAPAYDEDDPGETVITVSEERTVVLYVPMQKHDQILLNAVPWKDPQYCRLSSSNESIEGNEESTAEPHIPTIDDEDTIPSAWVPTYDQRPRNIQEADNAAWLAGIPEAHTVISEVDSATHLVPTSDDQSLQLRQPTVADNMPCTEPQPSLATDDNTDNNLGVTSDLGASSVSLQFDVDCPLRRFGRGTDIDEPLRKRTRLEDDAHSLSDASQASVPPLLDQDSCNSLFEGLTVIGPQPNRLTSVTSDSNLRRV